MTVVKTIIGRIPVYRGNWYSGVEVYKHNMFIHNGSEWISLIDGNTTEPSSGSATWELITAGGGGGGTSSQVIIDSSVMVNNGPLAEHLTSWVDDWVQGTEKIIPKGVTVQTVLEKLFNKDSSYDPGSLGEPVYSWGPIQNAPTAGFSDVSVGGLAEINTYVTVIFSADNTDVPTGQNATVSISSTDGYFIGSDTTYHSGNYSQTKSGVFSEQSVATGLWNDSSSVTTGSQVMVAGGTNTLKVSQVGKKCTVSEFDTDTVWPANSGHQKMSSGSKTVAQKSYGTKTLAATETSVNIFGTYPIYTNGEQAALDDSSLPADATNHPNVDQKLSIVGDGTEFGILFPAQYVQAYSIAIHSTKSIDSAYGFNSLPLDSTKEYDYDVAIPFVKGSSPVTRKSGNVDETYYIWTCSGTTGATRVKVKIKNN